MEPRLLKFFSSILRRNVSLFNVEFKKNRSLVSNQSLYKLVAK